MPSEQYEDQPASEVMSRNVVTAEVDDTVLTVVTQMRHQRISCVVIVDEKGFPAGILTERDLTKVIIDRVEVTETPVIDVASKPVVSVPKDTMKSKIIEMFLEHKIRHMVVTDEGKAVGCVTQTDLMHSFI